MPAPSTSLAARRSCIDAAMDFSVRNQSVAAMQGWPIRRYPKVGERSGHIIVSEASIVNLLDHTAYGRVNILLNEHGPNYLFTTHPPIRPIEPQVRVPAWLAAAML